MPDEDEIRSYKQRLNLHREHLSNHLHQVAINGAGSAPSKLLMMITQERKAIALLKLNLQNLNVECEDKPDDDDQEGSYAAEALQQQTIKAARVASRQQEKHREILAAGGRLQRPPRRNMDPSDDEPSANREPTDPPESGDSVDTAAETIPPAEAQLLNISWLPNFADEHLRILENELMQPLYWEELGEAAPLEHEYAVARYFYHQVNALQRLWKTVQDLEKTIEEDDLVIESTIKQVTDLLTAIHNKVSLISRAMNTIPDHPLYIALIETTLSVISSSNEVRSALLESQAVSEICLAIHELANALRELENQLQRMQQHVAQELVRVLGKEQFEIYLSQYPQQSHHNN